MGQETFNTKSFVENVLSITWSSDWEEKEWTQEEMRAFMESCLYHFSETPVKCELHGRFKDVNGVTRDYYIWSEN